VAPFPWLINVQEDKKKKTCNGRALRCSPLMPFTTWLIALAGVAISPDDLFGVFFSYI
jgi:hypothetical protein